MPKEQSGKSPQRLLRSLRPVYACVKVARAEQQVADAHEISDTLRDRARRSARRLTVNGAGCPLQTVGTATYSQINRERGNFRRDRDALSNSLSRAVGGR
jgi:hypothetical protein